MRKQPRSLHGLANTSAMFSYDNGLLAGYSSPGPWRIGWCVAHGGWCGRTLEVKQMVVKNGLGELTFE